MIATLCGMPDVVGSVLLVCCLAIFYAPLDALTRRAPVDWTVSYK